MAINTRLISLALEVCAWMALLAPASDLSCLSSLLGPSHFCLLRKLRSINQTRPEYQYVGLLDTWGIDKSRILASRDCGPLCPKRRTLPRSQAESRASWYGGPHLVTTSVTVNLLQNHICRLCWFVNHLGARVCPWRTKSSKPVHVHGTANPRRLPSHIQSYRK